MEGGGAARRLTRAWGETRPGWQRENEEEMSGNSGRRPSSDDVALDVDPVAAFRFLHFRPGDDLLQHAAVSFDRPYRPHIVIVAGDEHATEAEVLGRVAKGQAQHRRRVALPPEFRHHDVADVS